MLRLIYDKAQLIIKLKSLSVYLFCFLQIDNYSQFIKSKTLWSSFHYWKSSLLHTNSNNFNDVLFYQVNFKLQNIYASTDIIYLLFIFSIN